MFTQPSADGVYTAFSWRCSHSLQLTVFTQPSAGGVYTAFSWRCSHSLQLAVFTLPSAGGVHIAFSWRCLHCLHVMVFTLPSPHRRTDREPYSGGLLSGGVADSVWCSDSATAVVSVAFWKATSHTEVSRQQCGIISGLQPTNDQTSLRMNLWQRCAVNFGCVCVWRGWGWN